MPKTINGKKLTAAQHRQWKRVYEKTGSGAKATAAVKRSMKRKSRK